MKDMSMSEYIRVIVSQLTASTKSFEQSSAFVAEALRPIFDDYRAGRDALFEVFSGRYKKKLKVNLLRHEGLKAGTIALPSLDIHIVQDVQPVTAFNPMDLLVVEDGNCERWVLAVYGAKDGPPRIMGYDLGVENQKDTVLRLASLWTSGMKNTFAQNKGLHWSQRPSLKKPILISMQSHKQEWIEEHLVPQVLGNKMFAPLFQGGISRHPCRNTTSTVAAMLDAFSVGGR